MKKDAIVYSISMEDIQEVAIEELDRNLSPQELRKVAEEVGNHIDWYQAITLAIARSGIESTEAAK